MIIPNSYTTSGASPLRHISDDAPKVVIQTSESAAPIHQPSHQQLSVAVDSINQAIQMSHQSMEISVDFNTKIPVIKLLDTTTGELIRQIPSKEVLAIASSIDQFLKFQRGLLLNQKA